MATTETIGSGGDYGDINAWLDGTPDPPTGGYEGRLLNEEFNEAVVFDGFTTSATNFLKLTADPDSDASFQDNANVRINALNYNDANGAAVLSPGGSGDQFSIYIQYVYIERIQIKRSGSAYGIGVVYFGSGNQPENQIKDCIVIKDYAYGYGAFIASIRNGRAINCLFVDTNPASNHSGVMFRNEYGSGTPQSINNTIVAVGGGGQIGVVLSGSFQVLLKNTLVIGYDTPSDVGSGSWASGSDYNGTDEASGMPGANSIFNLVPSTEFENATNDFRLKAGASCIAEGNTDATNAPLDISGFTRGLTTAGDIGAWEFGASGGGNQTLTAGAGSYAISGQAASTKVGRKVAAGLGTYAVSGQAATPRVGRKVVADAGTYAVSGQAAVPRTARKLAGTGTYALTGVAAALKRALQLVASVGTYAVSGQAANLVRSQSLVGGAGTYSIAGQDAALTHVRKLLAGLGTYTISGQNANLIYDALAAVVNAEVGVYSITGNAAGLAVGRRIAAGQGVYSISGQTAALVAARKLIASAGNYAVSGKPAVLIHSVRLNADAGTYVVTGQNANLALIRVLQAATGVYTISGKTANLFVPVNSQYPNSVNAFILIANNSEEVYVIETLNNSENAYVAQTVNSENTIIL